MCKSAFVSLKEARRIIESNRRWQAYCESQGWKEVDENIEAI
jgi:hypothetical protein